MSNSSLIHYKSEFSSLSNAQNVKACINAMLILWCVLVLWSFCPEEFGAKWFPRKSIMVLINGHPAHYKTGRDMKICDTVPICRTGQNILCIAKHAFIVLDGLMAIMLFNTQCAPPIFFSKPCNYRFRNLLWWWWLIKINWKPWIKIPWEWRLLAYMAL